MSTQSVRCLYFPVQTPGREEIVAVEGGKLVIPQGFAEHTRELMLPDGVMIISDAESEASRAPINRRVANYAVRGDFIITKVDSQCDPVSLTEKEMAFYTAAAKTEDDTSTPADLGEDREVQIADIKVTYRRVKVPRVCECGADLTRNEALVVWSFSDEGYQGRLPRYAGDDIDSYSQLGFLMSQKGIVPRAGEESISNIACACSACGAVLAEGKLKFETAAD